MFTVLIGFTLTQRILNINKTNFVLHKNPSKYISNICFEFESKLLDFELIYCSLNNNNNNIWT